MWNPLPRASHSPREGTAPPNVTVFLLAKVSTNVFESKMFPSEALTTFPQLCTHISGRKPHASDPTRRTPTLFCKARKYGLRKNATGSPPHGYLKLSRKCSNSSCFCPPNWEMQSVIQSGEWVAVYLLRRCHLGSPPENYLLSPACHYQTSLSITQVDCQLL